MTWVTHIKGCSKFGYEISAILDTNKHGHESYGWGNHETKLIILSTKRNYNAEIIIHQSIIDATVAYAQSICDDLNAGGCPKKYDPFNRE